jgi:hypothetical protein
MFRAALERGERIGAGPVLRAWRSVLLLASRWYQIQSLYKFNAKYCPAWEPRFFVFPSGRDAPRIALAALQAEAFLTWPKLEATRSARRITRRPAASRRPARHFQGQPDAANTGLQSSVRASWPHKADGARQRHDDIIGNFPH